MGTPRALTAGALTSARHARPAAHAPPAARAQVVGLRGGWHTGLTMLGAFSRLHGKRLAQAAEIVIELRGHSARPMRLREGGMRVGGRRGPCRASAWPDSI